MEFNLLFTLVGNLTFVIEFDILPGPTQDFLFFNGDNASAHLYRENRTVILHVADVGFETYKSTIENKLEFSWEGFKINGTEMDKTKSNGSIDLRFDTFTFLSPIIAVHDINPREEEIIDEILSSETVNYYYILLIVLLVVLVVYSKPRTFRLVQSLLCKSRDADYEVMQPSNDTAKQSAIHPKETRI